MTNVDKIIQLHKKGLSSREISQQLYGRPTAKSTINDVLARFKKQSKQGGPKILLYDIETSAALMAGFSRWNQNFSQDQIFKEIMLFGAAAKWMGSDEIIEIYPSNFSNWDSDEEQKQMLSILHRLLDEADMVMGHNSDRFDNKIINAHLIKHGFEKPSPYRGIDTLKIAKRSFKFPSNSLDALGEFLGVGRKVKHSGFRLWRDCMLGDHDAFKEMIEYNVGDILLLEEVYMKLRSWDSQHPNISLHYDDNHLRCPVCSSTALEDTGKLAYTQVSAYPLIRCSDCGAWHRTRVNNLKGNDTVIGAK